MSKQITKTNKSENGKPKFDRSKPSFEQVKKSKRESLQRQNVTFQNVGKENVDRENGIIRNVSVNTVGEALGHGVWLEQEFVDNVARLGAEKKNGIKSRFGHPNMCGSAIGTLLGRLVDFRVEGEQCFADLHLSEVSKKAPAGDLYEYVLSLAENESDQFGLSIVFNVAYEYRRDESGEKIISPWWMIEGETESEWETRYDAFYASDSKDYIAIAELTACDVVDDPAANPEGLFESFDTVSLASQMTAFLDSHPEIYDAVDKNPAVLKEFLSRYEQYKQRKGGAEMSEENKEPVESEETAPVENKETHNEAQEEDEVTETPETPETPETDEVPEVDELSKAADDAVAAFCEIADEHGYQFAKDNAGKSKEDILLAANDKLKKELEEAKKYSAESEDSVEPVKYTAGETKKKISLSEVRKKKQSK